jgi:hypothetical protein
MRVRFGKAFLHGGRRCFTQQAEDHNPDAAEDKARNDFIQAQPANCFQTITVTAPMIIPASAPLRVMRDHITENSTTGPNAAPKPAHA